MALTFASTITTSVLVLAVLLPLAATSAEAQSYHGATHYNQGWTTSYNHHQQQQQGRNFWRRWWAQPRSLWQTARSIAPRVATVAYETASSLTVPAIALLSLLVLWPQHKVYRTRRDAGVSDKDEAMEDPNLDNLVDHFGNIFAAAVEGDKCMQRVACEIGVASSASLHPRHRKIVERLVTSYAPAKYTTLLNHFKTGAAMETCEKTGCHLIDFDNPIPDLPIQ